MSFDLAVWEGSSPANDADATRVYEQLYDRYVEAGGSEPTPAIRTYVEALLQRWPDITEEDDEGSPWADGPLIGNASGPFFYFAMVWSMAEEASTYAVALARQHGLVCFDPQNETLA